MKRNYPYITYKVAIILLLMITVISGAKAMNKTESIYSFKVKTIDGVEKNFAEYKGKVMLIVNVASKCGFTPQYKGLEDLYEKYKSRGFVILGFPCNQFGSQEPGSNGEIKEFCSTNYSVTFQMFEKIDVNGDEAHPLYKYLKNTEPGILGTTAIKWNFTKFLIDRSGKIIDRYAPSTTPESISNDIEKLLGK